jgi:VIT1/CCC1 family predicted Fe2+/Mn2+ transporter
LQRDDIMGAIQIFSIALCATLPATMPLVLSDQSKQALRISNFLVVGLLFIVGYRWAKYVDVNRWWAGFGLMSLGLILVGVALALGG